VLYVTANYEGSSDGKVFDLIPPAQAGAPWTQTTLSNLARALGLFDTSGVVMRSMS
jgi:hypothetical protein